MSNNFKEGFAEKIFYIILLNKDNNTFDVEKIVKILDIDKNEFIDYCKDNERLIITENEEETLIDINNNYITDETNYQVYLINIWKEGIIKFLKKNNNIKSSELANIIKRPNELLKIIKFEDILKFDYKKRFLIINEDSIKIIKYKFTPEELEELHNEWLNNIENYLQAQDDIQISLVLLGSIIKKPNNLGKNQKLIDIIKNDRRFELIENKKHNSLTKIRLFNHKKNIIIPSPGFTNLNHNNKKNEYKIKVKTNSMINSSINNYYDTINKLSPISIQAQHSPSYGRTHHSPSYGRVQHSPSYEKTHHSPSYGRTQHSPSYGRTQHSPSYGRVQYTRIYERVQHSQTLDNNLYLNKIKHISNKY